MFRITGYKDYGGNQQFSENRKHNILENCYVFFFREWKETPVLLGPWKKLTSISGWPIE
jgi:hypothetical protein